MRQVAPAKLTKCGIGRAAQILDKTEAAVRKGVERRQVPHRRLGRNIFFFEEELYQLLDTAPGLRLEDVSTLSRY